MTRSLSSAAAATRTGIDHVEHAFGGDVTTIRTLRKTEGLVVPLQEADTTANHWPRNHRPGPDTAVVLTREAQITQPGVGVELREHESRVDHPGIVAQNPRINRTYRLGKRDVAR